MPVPRAGAGMCARRRTFFSCVAKKRRQKKATPSLRPLRCAKGQTCGGAVAGCAAELTARLGRFARTAAASQMTKHGRTGAHATPQPPRRRRSHRGWIAKQPNSQTAKQPNSHTGRRCARPDRRCALWVVLPPSVRAELVEARAYSLIRPHACAPEVGPSAAMARRDVGCSAPKPLCMRRGAQRPVDQGSRLFERSEFERDPAGREHRRLPEAKRRDADSGVALSLVTFFRSAIRRRSERT